MAYDSVGEKPDSENMPNGRVLRTGFVLNVDNIVHSGSFSFQLYSLKALISLMGIPLPNVILFHLLGPATYGPPVVTVDQSGYCRHLLVIISCRGVNSDSNDMLHVGVHFIASNWDIGHHFSSIWSTLTSQIRIFIRSFTGLTHFIISSNSAEKTKTNSNFTADPYEALLDGSFDVSPARKREHLFPFGQGYCHYGQR